MTPRKKMTWNDQFLALFRHCVEEYREGNKDFTTFYTPDDVAFLSSIGYRPHELFDFVEDLVDGGGREPVVDHDSHVVAANLDRGVPARRRRERARRLGGAARRDDQRRGDE